VIYFTDTNGIARYWQFGWYCWIDGATGPPPWGYITPDGLGIVYSTQVACGSWYPWSFNLLAELNSLAPPRTIDKIRVGGSGWDFEGLADNIVIVGNPTSVASTSWGTVKALFRE
jgi:hypothetical protein